MKIDPVKKIPALLFLMFGLFICAQAQRDWLYLNTEHAVVTRVFRPKSKIDAHIFTVHIRKNQEVSIKVKSNSIYLSMRNECGIYFRLFDDNGKELVTGDSPAGIDDWSGYVDKAGTYDLRIYMGCLESFTARQLTTKKPKFVYTLTIGQPLAPSRQSKVRELKGEWRSDYEKYFEELSYRFVDRIDGSGRPCCSR